MAAMMVWAADPNLQSPEDRLPVGAIARIGNVRFARPCRWTDMMAISNDGRSLMFMNPTDEGVHKLEWWDLKTFRRVIPPFVLGADERLMGHSAAGFTTMVKSGGYTLRDEQGRLRMRIPARLDWPSHQEIIRFVFGESGDFAFAELRDDCVIEYQKQRDGTVFASRIAAINKTSNLSFATRAPRIAWGDATQIEIYDTTLLRAVLTVKPTDDFPRIQDAILSPDGTAVAVVSSHKQNTRKYQCKIHSLSNPGGVLLNDPNSGENYRTLRFSNDGELVVMLNSAANDSCAFSARDGKLIWQYKSDDPREQAMSADGKTVAYLNNYGRFKVVDVIRKKELTPKLTTFGQFARGGLASSKLAWATSDSSNDPPTAASLTRWDPTSGRSVEHYPLAFDNTWNLYAVSTDAQRVGLSKRNESHFEFRITDPKTAKIIAEWNEAQELKGAIGPFLYGTTKAIVRRGGHWGISDFGPNGRFYSFGKEDIQNRLLVPPDQPMLITPDLRLFIILSQSKQEIIAIETATAEVRYVMPTPMQRGGNQMSVSIAFSPDARHLIVNSSGSFLQYDVLTGRLIRLIEMPGQITDAGSKPFAVSKTGRFLATVKNFTQEISIIDTEQNPPVIVQKFLGATSDVIQLMFDPADQYLVSFSDDGTAITWSLKTLDTRPAAPKVDPKADWWVELASSEQASVMKAIRQILTHDGKAFISRAAKEWRPDATIPLAILRKAVADLDSDDFRVREKALILLQQHAAQAADMLKLAARSATSAEVRAKAAAIVDEIENFETNPQRIRWLRVIELLERLGSKDAEAVLKTIASGPKFSRLTQEAEKALGRLASPLP